MFALLLLESSVLSKLKLYFKWGIKFGEPFMLADKATRSVTYMERDELFRAIERKYPQKHKAPPAEEYDYSEISEAKPKINIKTNGGGT